MTTTTHYSTRATRARERRGLILAVVGAPVVSVIIWGVLVATLAMF